jgi:DNA modification methylase
MLAARHVTASYPYWQGHGLTLYHGDSREIVPALNVDGALDEYLVVADPPYGIKHPCNFGGRGRGKRWRSSNYNPVHADDEHFDPRWLLTVGRGRVLWGANHFASKLPDVSGWLVWDKKRPDDLDQATCELAWADVVKGVRRFSHLWHGCTRASEQGRGKLVHPTQKPIALMEWVLSLRWTKGYAHILDPYMGSGPVLLAALRQGKTAIGIEYERDYCDVTIERIHREVERRGQVTPEAARPGEQVGLFA